MVDLTALRFDLGPSWLNLLGSVGSAYGPAPIERMTGPDRLAEWLAHEGLTPASGEVPAETDIELARELREALRSLMLSRVRDRPINPDAVTVLNRFLAADEPLHVTVTGTGPYLEPPRTVTAALARVAREAADHLTGPEAAHIHQCAAEDCAGAFIDESGRRRWCSDDRCGVKSRVRAHRARQRP
jgi:predicted RNA-binding Zn ribbon-like protein